MRRPNAALGRRSARGNYGQRRRCALACNAAGTLIDLAVSRYLVQLLEIDMIKYAVCVALLIGVSAPAFAAEYYIVRGSDKKCKVVETRPTDKTMIVVGDKAYITREEATKQLTVVCKD